MAPARHTDQEEQTFMNGLLSGLDDSIKPKQESGSTLLARHALPPTRNTSNISTASSATLVNEEEIAFLLEGAEDWDWDDDFMSPKKSPMKKSPMKRSPVKSRSSHKANSPPRYNQTCTRCTVQSVSEDVSKGQLEKRLVVKTDPGGEHRVIVLRDEWTQTSVRAGDIVNVLGQFSSGSAIHITAKENLLVLHPDILLTPSTLSSPPQCSRKPLVSNLVRASVDASPALVWGNMLHEVMQSCLSDERWDQSFMNQKIEEVARQMLPDLLKLNVTVDTAVTEAKARAKGLTIFFQRYLSQTPKPDAVLTNTRATNGETSLLAISGVLDIEEDILSPSYGLKGKLDVSVDTVVENHEKSFFSKKQVKSVKNSTGPMPFEIKTGRAVAGLEHRAQTMLYTLLMSERYGVQIDEGLLYYTQNDEVVRVPAARNEIRSLIVVRNELASYMMRRAKKHGQPFENRPEIEEPFLPPTIDDERTCGRCFALDTCMLYRKAVENVQDDSSDISEIYNRKTSHITPPQADFFKKWEALISAEEIDLVRFKKELWTMGASEREAHGRCFAAMTLDSTYKPSKGASVTGGWIHQFTYRFTKRSWNPTPTSGSKSLLNGHMSVGEAITVSVEPNLLALAKGFIIELTPEEVIVGVDHVLDLAGISALLRAQSDDVFDDVVLFRIDKDEMFGGMGRIRYNLAHLFYSDGDTRRLQLVVDLRSPKFVQDAKGLDHDLRVQAAAKGLNQSQREAIKKVLDAEDYALILGMPGSGKTTVIAAIIKVLVGMGKTVLVTSYTHTAVDTILLKLKDDTDFGILRLGNADKVHPEIHQYTLSARRAPTSVEQLEHQVMTPPVVATTCLSVDHPLFSRRTFDYCIVDEASQITLPTCLGPLRYADKFVLVGDHFQLPPLVRSRAARSGGLDVSLFRRLSDAHPHSVVDLALQYRMNSEIMLLSNRLIYGDRLRCGSAEVAKRSLNIPNKNFIDRMHSSEEILCRLSAPCWLQHLLDPECKAVFVDTDEVPAKDSKVGDLVQNEIEAQLVYQLSEALIGSGVREDQIGILSLYRQQIKLLSHLLHARKGIEILTADRSQGRDKDCIIVSLVRSNDDGQLGDLVKDWRRMNVSFTRARSKLVIFGSRKTLEGDKLLGDFFELMNEQGWMFKLPAGANVMHTLSDSLKTKRGAPEGSLDKTPGLDTKESRPRKKAKTGELGLLRGRPLLKDLLNGNK